MSCNVASVVLVMLCLTAWRVTAILPSNNPRRQRLSSDKCTVAVFLGSGGHTSEALALMSALDFRRYNKRVYIVSEGDILSAQKALDFESSRKEDPSNCKILTLPRARQVHQGLLTTPLSAFRSLVSCVSQLTLIPTLNMGRKGFADVLILNGPGTCFVLCVAIYINKVGPTASAAIAQLIKDIQFLGLPAPTLIYVETFARIKSLSLSGRLIRPVADRFITQWEDFRTEKLSSARWLV